MTPQAGTLTRLVRDAANAHKQQQRVRQLQQEQQLVLRQSSTGGGPTERTTSLRSLKHSLSFLRRSLTPRGGGGGGGGGASSSDAAAASAIATIDSAIAGGTASPRRTLALASGGGGAAVAVSPRALAPPASGGGSEQVPSASEQQQLPLLPYTDREALQWCMEIALALQYLHAQSPPVVHRDIKTDNVLLAVALPGASVSSAVVAAAAPTSGAVPPAPMSPSGMTAAALLMGSHGGLARRVLSIRAAAAAAAAGAADLGSPSHSRGGSMTAALAGRPGGGRPLTAKVCDFGLHVVGVGAAPRYAGSSRPLWQRHVARIPGQANIPSASAKCSWSNKLLAGYLRCGLPSAGPLGVLTPFIWPSRTVYPTPPHAIFRCWTCRVRR